VTTFLAYLAVGFIQGLIYGLLALGLVLVYKGTRVVNFAHPYFGLVCAFMAWWLTAKASYPPFSWLPFEENSLPRFAIAAVLALVIIALYGLAVEHGVMRRLRQAPRLVQLVATIALAQGAVGLVQILFNRTEEQASTFRSLPVLLPSAWQFDIGARTVTPAEVQVLIVVPVICVAAALFFTRTKFGVAIRAAAENVDAARLLGISADRVSMFVWVTGALLAGVAGLLITQTRGSLDVATLSTGFLIRALTAALIGGLVSLPGAVVGGLIVGIAEFTVIWFVTQVLESNDVALTSGGPEAFLFVLVIAFLIFRPGGLFGEREETEDKVAFVPTLRDLPLRLRHSAPARAVRVLGVLLMGAACLMSLVAGSATNDILIRVVIFAMVGVSLTVLMGYSGQISLGHWGLTGFGAFALANFYERLDVPYLLSLPLVVLAGMAVSLLVGLPALRIKGLYLAVVTLGFSLAAEFYLFKTEWFGNGTAGFTLSQPKLGPFDLAAPTGRPLFFFSVIMLVLCMIVARNLANSRSGRGFYALRENEKAAATLGVKLTQYRLLAFAVSGGIAALAGALYATNLGRADPFLWDTGRWALTLVAIVMIGGIGSLTGSILGAFLVVGLPQLIHFDNPWIVPIGTGILLLIVILRARGGLAGLVQRIRETLVTSLDELAQQQQPPPRHPQAQQPAA
jgi:ABC-type branched-subunit amino acid transport system permease subunit